MTHQRADIIIIKGKEHLLFSNPLDDYWNKKNPKPSTGATKSSCRRGYVARWEISENCLYLIDITFFAPDGEHALNYVFPQNTGKIKAVWFTGTLRMPLGDCLQYFHLGYESIYDSDCYIKIRKGNIKRQRYKANY